MTSPIAIIGAGGWGTALAVTMARARKPVRLWVYESDLVAAMRKDRVNSIYLPNVQLPETIEISSVLDEVLQGSKTVVVAVPSHVFRSVITQVAAAAAPEMNFVSAAKGIENGTLMRMSEVIQDVIAPHFAPRVAVISGPTFAPEVARGEPTALVIASTNDDLRRFLQTELSAPRFRLYTNFDPIGVEIGAAASSL